MSVRDQAMIDEMRRILIAAIGKLKTSADEGPGGKNAELTPAECMGLIRIMECSDLSTALDKFMKGKR